MNDYRNSHFWQVFLSQYFGNNSAQTAGLLTVLRSMPPPPPFGTMENR